MNQTLLRAASARHIVREDLLEPDQGTCFLLRGALTPGECQDLTAWAERNGFAETEPLYPPSYRNNERLVVDDPDLARRLFRRIEASLPRRMVGPDGSEWELVGLNERFRACRYVPGQFFGIHRDGVFWRSADERSWLTCMLYLNEGFGGGATRYVTSRRGDETLIDVVPEAGTLIVFEHDLWHEGRPIESGTKYVLRSDVLYRRVSGGEKPAGSHLGYVWSVLELADGRLASGSRDKTIKLWERDSRGIACVETLTGHRNSVVALAQNVDGALWSGSRDQTIRLWRLDGPPRCERTVDAHAGAVLSLAPLGDGRVASGGADGWIRLWSPQGDLAGELLGHSGWVWGVASLGGGALASASEDGTVRVWEEGRTRLQLSVGAPVHCVLGLGDRIAAGSGDGTVRVWDRRGELLATLRGHEGSVCALAQLDGDTLASGGEDDTIRIWRGGHCQAVWRHADFVRNLAVLRDGALLSGSYDATVRVWPRAPAT